MNRFISAASLLSALPYFSFTFALAVAMALPSSPYSSSALVAIFAHIAAASSPCALTQSGALSGPQGIRPPPSRLYCGPGSRTQRSAAYEAGRSTRSLPAPSSSSHVIDLVSRVRNQRVQRPRSRPEDVVVDQDHRILREDPRSGPS